MINLELSCSCSYSYNLGVLVQAVLVDMLEFCKVGLLVVVIVLVIVLFAMSTFHFQ
jgi:hypothetical protein